MRVEDVVVLVVCDVAVFEAVVTVEKVVTVEGVVGIDEVVEGDRVTTRSARTTWLMSPSMLMRRVRRRREPDDNDMRGVMMESIGVRSYGRDESVGETLVEKRHRILELSQLWSDPCPSASKEAVQLCWMIFDARHACVALSGAERPKS